MRSQTTNELFIIARRPISAIASNFDDDDSSDNDTPTAKKLPPAPRSTMSASSASEILTKKAAAADSSDDDSSSDDEAPVKKSARAQNLGSINKVGLVLSKSLRCLLVYQEPTLLKRHVCFFFAYSLTSEGQCHRIGAHQQRWNLKQSLCEGASVAGQ